MFDMSEMSFAGVGTAVGAAVSKGIAMAGSAGKLMSTAKIIPLVSVAAQTAGAGLSSVVSGTGAFAGGGLATQAVGSVVTLLGAASTAPALLPAATCTVLAIAVAAGVKYAKTKSENEGEKESRASFHDQDVGEPEVSLQTVVNARPSFS